MTTAVRDDRLPITCPKCGKEFKVLYPIYKKGNMIGMACEKCVKELTGGEK